MEADDTDVLDHNPIVRKLRDRARGEADHDVAAGPGDATQRAVGAPAVGEAQHGGDEVLGLVVDRQIDAEALKVGYLVGAAGGSQNPGSCEFGELDRGEADAARAGVNEQRFADLQLGPRTEREPRGLPGDQHRGRCFGRKSGRAREHVGGRNDSLLGESPAHRVGHHRRSDCEIDPGTDGRNHVRQLTAWCERRFAADLVLAGDGQRIAEIDTGRLDADPDFARSRDRARNFAELQHLVEMPVCRRDPSADFAHAGPASTR